MEVLTYSKLGREDLALGNGTFETRLADGRVVTLNKIHTGNTALRATVQLACTNGTTTLTASALIPAGARVLGVTTKQVVTPGATNSLTGFDVGDAVFLDRWGSGIAIADGAKTTQADFTDDDQPLYKTAADVIITGDQNFDGTGIIEVRAHYYLLTHE